MSDEWFCRILGSVLGPLSWDELSAMAREQSLISNDFVRQGREGEWIKANSVEGLFPRVRTDPPQPTAASGDQTAVAVDALCLAELDDSPITAQIPDAETLLEIAESVIADADADSMPPPAKIPARPPLPITNTESIFTRSHDFLRSLSRRNQTGLLIVVLLVVGVVWFLSHQRRVAYRAAYAEVQRLHRHWQQAKAEPLDPASTDAFQQKLNDQRQRVVDQLAGIRAGSAGGAVREAATVFGELMELSNASDRATDRSQRAALEKRFHDSMRQARQGLFAE
ncbi:MAG: DUF4339 domain-containing protein [Planctomycetaceae bacterium]